MAGSNKPGEGVGIGRLYEIGLGWLNLSIDELEKLTLFQFNCKLKGYQEQEEKRNKEQWERTRILIDGIWRTVAWKNKKVPDVRESYPLPWDQAPKVEIKKELTEIEQVEKWYKFKMKNKVVYNRDKEKLIQKHYNYLVQKFGEI